jgi:hypothetical protein
VLADLDLLEAEIPHGLEEDCRARDDHRRALGLEAWYLSSFGEG